MTAALNSYYDRSRRFLALGLTTRGHPRKRTLPSSAENKTRRLERWHKRSSLRVENGLTTRGTKRKRRDLNVHARRWQQFKALIFFTDKQTAVEAEKVWR